jgi:uncharacterized small protein (TIGR04563 family)
MSVGAKRKQSLYFPEAMLREVGAEAARMDRSLSWIVQRAWKASRKEILKIPSVNEPLQADREHARDSSSSGGESP